jgi:hypothetical protein
MHPCRTPSLAGMKQRHTVCPVKCLPPSSTQCPAVTYPLAPDDGRQVVKHWRPQQREPVPVTQQHNLQGAHTHAPQKRAQGHFSARVYLSQGAPKAATVMLTWFA